MSAVRKGTRRRGAGLGAVRAWLRLGFVLLAIASGGIAGEEVRASQTAPGAPSSTNRGGTRWALIVGVDTYQSGDIAQLSGAAADARAIAAALVKYAEFPEDQVFLLTSDGPAKPTQINVIERFDAIKKRATADDLLLFFFAGHGVQVEGERYLLTNDSRVGSAAQIKVTTLSATKLRQEIESVHVAHRIIMVDACRDDPTGGQNRVTVDAAYEKAFTLDATDEKGIRATFLSSSRGQSAYEWAEKGRGYFSYFLEEGLAGAAATRGKVTFTSLIDYLNEFVPRAVREQINREQVPYTAFEGPPFVLVRNEMTSRAVRAFDQPLEQPSARTVYGIVKDSQGRPVPSAAIRVSFASGTRGISVAGTDKSESQTPDLKELATFADEDGFFRVEGIPPGVDATVAVSGEAFAAKSVVSGPAEAGKKLTIFLARLEAEPAPEIPKIESTLSETTGELVVRPAPAKPAAGPALAGFTAEPAAAELGVIAYWTFVSEDFEEAERAALEALEADPDEPLANAVLGNVLAVQGINSKNPKLAKKAGKFIQKALKGDPDHALALNAKAVTLIAGGSRRDAQKILETVVRLDPGLAVARANLGYIYMEQGNLADAEREIREAIRLYPVGAINYNNLSQVLFRSKNYEAMERACREAISRYQPRDRYLGLFYAELATALFHRERRDQALENVARAKALGVTDHPIFAQIERPKGRKR